MARHVNVLKYQVKYGLGLVDVSGQACQCTEASSEIWPGSSGCEWPGMSMY